MVISISKQFGLVIYSLAAGILTGTLFDFYRVIRGFNSTNNVITFIEDTLFWIFAGIVVFLFLLCNNYAYIGMYVYVWMIIGTYLYMKLISRFFLRYQYRFFRLFGKVIRYIINTIIYPFQFIFYSINTKNKRNYKK